MKGDGVLSRGRRAAASAILGGILLAPQPGAAADDEKLVEYLEKSYACQKADEWYQLAQWCKANGFPDRVERNLRRAIKWEPDHAKAREELGFILYDGPNAKWRERKWLDGSEKEAALKELADLAEKEKAERATRKADPYLSQCDDVIARYKADTYVQNLRIDWDYLSRRDVLERYKPYVLMIEGGKTFHYQQIGELLNQYYKHFMTDYASRFDLPEVDRPLPVVALQGQDGYEKFCIYRGIAPDKTRAAHYDPVRGEVICHGDESYSGSYPYRPVINNGVFTHEATHQILDHYTKVKTGRLAPSRSHWFQEGIAEYIGTLRHVDKTREGLGHAYLFGRYAADRAAEFRARMLGKKSIFDLQEMLRISDRGEMVRVAREKDSAEWQTMTSLFYAEAWTLIHFFRKYEDGRPYWDKFLRYFNEELNGRSGFDVFEAIFQITDYGELERQWNEFVEKFV
jgi:hypothetical protein